MPQGTSHISPQNLRLVGSGGDSLGEAGPHNQANTDSDALRSAHLMRSGLSNPLNVLLGDAHPLFRSGMRYLLNDEFSPAAVVEVGTRDDVLDHLERGGVDLVITGLFSSKGDYAEFLDKLLQRAPSGRLIILSSVDQPDLICRILMAGAAGFVLKETPPAVTLQAIRLVLAGGVYIPPAALSPRPAGLETEAGVEVRVETSVSTVALTDRQRAVLDLVVRGASNKHIARSLNISESTAKAHVASLLRMYGVDNRAGLVHAASRAGKESNITAR